MTDEGLDDGEGKDLDVGQAVFPAFPPGFWRRLIIHPGEGGMVAAALEDEVHRLSLVLHHEAGRVTRVAARTERVPYNTCSGAGDAIAGALAGRSLEALAAIDPREHCTHLYDLAVAAAAHADATGLVCYDMRVGDRVDDRATAAITRDGEPLCAWWLEGTAIVGPGAWAGRDLRQLSVWKHDLPPPVAFAATLLRRAVFVSGVRRQPQEADVRATEYGLARQGVCFTHQMPRALEAVRSRNWRLDFSDGTRVPLAGFVPGAS